MAERLWVRLRVKDLYCCPKEELDYIHISRINFHVVILSLDLIETHLKITNQVVIFAISCPPYWLKQTPPLPVQVKLGLYRKPIPSG